MTTHNIDNYSDLKTAIGSWVNSNTPGGDSFNLVPKTYDIIEGTEASIKRLQIYNWYGIVRGSQSANAVLDANHEDSLVKVEGTFGGDLVFEYMTFSRGSAPRGGGFFICKSSNAAAYVVIRLSKFISCKATDTYSIDRGGGGIFLENDSTSNRLLLQGVDFESNLSANGLGLDLVNAGATVVVDVCPDDYITYAGTDLWILNGIGHTDLDGNYEANGAVTVPAQGNSFGLKKMIRCERNSEAPSSQPSQSPTEFPTRAPSSAPSQAPTFSPSSAPSQAPTFSPSTLPSAEPSQAPTTIAEGKAVGSDSIKDQVIGKFNQETIIENIPGFVAGLIVAAIFLALRKVCCGDDGKKNEKSADRRRKRKKKKGKLYEGKEVEEYL